MRQDSRREKERQVKKALIITVLLLLIVLPCAFCDPDATFGFKVRREYEEQSAHNIRFFFVEIGTYSEGTKVNTIIPGGDASRATTPANPTLLDYGTSSLEVPQLGFAIWTKNVYNFTLRFRFSRMVSTDGTGFGGYTVRIFRPKYFNTNNDKVSYSDTLDNLETACTVSVEYDSENGVSALVSINNRSYSGKAGDYYSFATFVHGEDPFDRGREGWLYPMAFNFTGSEYTESGDYTATITVEVISNT